MFGIGLIVSGMANSEKVLGFLDLAAPGIHRSRRAVGALAFTFARKRTVSLLGLQMKMPTATQLDRRLIGGSLMFGVGWGIAGFCPGPALVALGAGEAKAVVFVVAILAGMGVFELLERRGAPRGRAGPTPNLDRRTAGSQARLRCMRAP